MTVPTLHPRLLCLVAAATLLVARTAFAEPPPLEKVGNAMTHNDNVRDIRFSPTGKHLLVPLGGGSVIWDAEKQTVVGAKKERNGRVVSPFPALANAAVTSDGKELIHISQVIQRWSLKTGKPLPRPVPVRPGLFDLSFSRDAKTCLWVHYTTPKGRDRLDKPTAQLLSASTGKTIGRALPLGEHPVKGSRECPVWALSPDGRIAAVVWPGKTVQRWDVVAGKRLEPDLSFQEKLDIWKLRFNDSGNVLTAETSNGPVSRLFDPKTGDALSPNIESAVVVSPDGKLFAAVGQTKKVTVQEVGTNKTVGTLTPELFDGTVHRLAFSPDGKMAVTFSFLNDRPVVPFLAFVAGRNRLKVWSTTTGKVLAQSDVIDGGVIQVRMSPDGKSFASSADATVQLWKMPAP